MLKAKVSIKITQREDDSFRLPNLVLVASPIFQAIGGTWYSIFLVMGVVVGPHENQDGFFPGCVHVPAFCLEANVEKRLAL